MIVAVTNIGRIYGIGEVLDGKESPETLENWIVKGKAARIAERTEEKPDKSNAVESAPPVKDGAEKPARKGTGKETVKPLPDDDGMEIVNTPAPQIDVSEGIVTTPRKKATGGKKK